jgi:hypothetical protein
MSADHSHTYSGTTATENANHSHAVSDPGHLHSIAYAAAPGSSGTNNATGGGTGTYITETGSAVTSISLGTESATHAHTYSGTSSGVSANHTHSVSGTSDATGSGTAATTISPYYALAYIMKS